MTGNQNPVFICAMKSKTIGLTLALFFAAGAVCFAANANMGTWKLNMKKSKLSRDANRNNTVVYSSAFFQTKVTIDGTDAKGKPIHSEWKGNFDGKDHAVTGDPMEDMRAYTKVDDHTLNFTMKKGGKVVLTGKIVVAADGKSRTVTAWSMKGKKKVMSTAAYDKA